MCIAYQGSNSSNIVEIEISKKKYPESAKHIEDAIADGKPDVLTIDRANARANRKASLKGIDKVPGKDLDEYPPAMFMEGGCGASVRPINPSDNRGAGSTFGHQLRQYPNGTKIRINITDGKDWALTLNKRILNSKKYYPEYIEVIKSLNENEKAKIIDLLVAVKNDNISRFGEKVDYLLQSC